jgi:glutaredoxin
MKDNIILYHQDGCPQCKLFFTLLKNKNIEFTSIKDVDLMISLNITHTPTIEVNGKRMTGKEAINWINSYKGN